LGHYTATGLGVDKLHGCSVLVVEDEPFVALDLAEALKGAGAHVVTAHKVADAVAAVDKIRSKPRWSISNSAEKICRRCVNT